MLKGTVLVAGALLMSASSIALADSPQQYAQAQTQNRSQMDADFQKRMNDAKTPQEKARIQAEHDRMMQQGAMPDSGNAVRTAPGTAGSGTMPERSDGATQAGQSPGGGGAVPKGQGGD